jgi:hypothetical protein
MAYSTLYTIQTSVKHLEMGSELIRAIRYGVVANIIASHAIALGSIPSVGDFSLSQAFWN